MNAAGLPRIHVESVGSGPPLVMLHGWGMHGGLFGPVLSSLAERARLHIVDLPGHGYSAPLSPLTLDGVVAELDAALSHQAGPLAVLGWSLGGAIALHWAATRPDRVAKLILVGATPSFVARDDWPHAMRAQTLSMFGDELRTAYRLTLQRFLTLQVQDSASGRATLAALRHQLFARGEPAPGVLDASLALLESIDLRGVVATLRAPALVIAGGRDTLAPPEASRWLAGALPRARLVEIPDAAHVPFLSHREAFVAAVRDFVDAG
jgi:pimeloyl-[acyl-carrier protein] methyl ester esterase